MRPDTMGCLVAFLGQPRKFCVLSTTYRMNKLRHDIFHGRAWKDTCRSVYNNLCLMYKYVEG